MAMDIGTRLRKEVEVAQDAVNTVESMLLDLKGFDEENELFDLCEIASDAIMELGKAVRKADSRGEL